MFVKIQNWVNGLLRGPKSTPLKFFNFFLLGFSEIVPCGRHYFAHIVGEVGVYGAICNSK